MVAVLRPLGVVVTKAGCTCSGILFASNLYARRVEVKIISKLLGHASVEITYNR